MHKLLLSAFLLFFCVSLSAQIADENFNDSKLPEGWTTTINSGTCEWNTFTKSTPNGPDFASVALLYDDDNCGEYSQPSNVSILTKKYDISGVSPVSLSVEVGFSGIDGGESVTIEVYDGTEWQSILYLESGQKRYPFTFQREVTEFANADFQVRFTYDDNGQWSWYAGIDNFKLTQTSNTSLIAQDQCSTAATVTAGTHDVEPINMGYAPEDACFSAKKAAGAAWFKYVATISGSATVNTAIPSNPAIDTRVSILKGSCDALTCLTFNDDTSSGTRAKASFKIEEGEEYFIVFDDYWTSSGFQFELTEEAYDCPDDETYAFNFSDEKAIQVCHTQVDEDGDGSYWIVDSADFDDNDPDNEVYYIASAPAEQDSNDFLYSPGLMLNAGVTYAIDVAYNVTNTARSNANESIDIFMADAPNSASKIKTLHSNTGVAVTYGSLNEIYTKAIRTDNVEFTPSTTGEYFLGINKLSPANSGILVIFEYSISRTLSTKNPTSNAITRYYNAKEEKLIVNAPSEIESVQLYNIMGQEIASKQNLTNTAEVSLASFPKGVYIAKITANGITENFKLLRD